MEQLTCFANNTKNAVKNFNIACIYKEKGQLSAAISFYLRTAELSDEDDAFAYESLVHISTCLGALKNRIYSEQGYLLHAIKVNPERPEAWWLLSMLHERKKEWQESYTAACTGINFLDKGIEFNHSIGFEPYKLIFQKAVSAWWIGQVAESRKIFFELPEYPLDPDYIRYVQKNITFLGIGNYPFLPYTPDMMSSLRYRFNGCETIKQNHSQVYQDLFVLSMTDGKRGGYYMDIGCADPVKGNNTYLLEKNFGWNGVSIDINENEIKKYKGIRKNMAVCRDASAMNFTSFLKGINAPRIIDYLQIDCEPPETTYNILLSIPFGDYDFRVITFEHDYYADASRRFRKLSRDYLAANGYELVVSDIAADDDHPFEDWYAKRELNVHTIDLMKDVSDGTKRADKYFFSSVTKKQRWNTTKYPTLEITTAIPKSGCPVDCVFCPQNTLTESYHPSVFAHLLLDDFKYAIESVPENVRITFAGFSEPFLNKSSSEMILYAHKKGHQVSVFTTGIGMDEDDFNLIKDIPFASGPNAGFYLHVPDSEEYSNHPVNDQYLKILKLISGYVKNGKLENFYAVSMGKVIPELDGFFDDVIVQKMYSRAGNLIKELIKKPSLNNHINRITSINKGKGAFTCGCDEGVYHPVLLPDGSLVLCCMDYSLGHRLGNLFKERWEKIVPVPDAAFELCRFCENSKPVKYEI